MEPNCILGRIFIMGRGLSITGMDKEPVVEPNCILGRIFIYAEKILGLGNKYGFWIAGN